MGDIFRNFLERELHETEAFDPKMKLRNRARLVIILSALPIVPLGVVILMITMLSWDQAESFSTDIWVAALLYPFLSCLAVMIAMTIHKQAFYRISAITSSMPQVACLVFFIYAYVKWVLE